MTGDHRRLRPARLRPAARLLRARNQRAEPVNAPQWQHAMAVQLDQRLRRPGTAAAQPARPPAAPITKKRREMATTYLAKKTFRTTNVRREPACLTSAPHAVRVPDVSPTRCLHVS